MSIFDRFVCRSEKKHTMHQSGQINCPKKRRISGYYIIFRRRHDWYVRKPKQRII